MNQAKHVLIVEDSANMREAYTAYFRELESTPVFFETASSVWRVFKSEPSAIKAIITNGDTPNRSGTWLARKVRAIAPDLPIILISADPVELTRARRSGLLTEVHAKPLSSEELIQLVRRLHFPAS